MSRPKSWSRKSAASSEEVVAETFKVLVLGGSDVGKSSLVKHYTSGGQAASANLLPTVGEL